MLRPNSAVSYLERGRVVNIGFCSVTENLGLGTKN